MTFSQLARRIYHLPHSSRKKPISLQLDGSKRHAALDGDYGRMKGLDWIEYVEGMDAERSGQMAVIDDGEGGQIAVYELTETRTTLLFKARQFELTDTR